MPAPDPKATATLSKALQAMQGSYAWEESICQNKPEAVNDCERWVEGLSAKQLHNSMDQDVARMLGLDVAGIIGELLDVASESKESAVRVCTYAEPHMLDHEH